MSFEDINATVFHQSIKNPKAELGGRGVKLRLLLEKARDRLWADFGFFWGVQSIFASSTKLQLGARYRELNFA